MNAESKPDATRGPADGIVPTSGKDDALPAVAEITAPPTRKVGTTVSQETFDALTLARSRDRIDTQTRVRMLIEIWRQDEQLRNKVERLARSAKSR